MSSAWSSTTEVVARFASGEMLKGRTAACDYPPPVRQVPVVASVKPEYEKIAKMQPDLVLYDALLYSESDVAKIKGTGDTFAFTANTLDGFLDELAELGGLLLQETSVSNYIDKIVDERTMSQSDPTGRKPKVVFLLPGHGSAI